MFARESPYLPVLKLVLAVVGAMLLVTTTSWGWAVVGVGLED